MTIWIPHQTELVPHQCVCVGFGQLFLGGYPKEKKGTIAQGCQRYDPLYAFCLSLSVSLFLPVFFSV